MTVILLIAFVAWVSIAVIALAICRAAGHADAPAERPEPQSTGLILVS